MSTPAELLDSVIPLVRAAGESLAAEFARPGGPRGGGSKADIDTEIEWVLRTALLALGPARYVGEETGTGGDAGAAYCWLVDPHDGTSSFLKGARGTSVSVGLLRDGVPVLGVVYAPDPPDRGPDMIAWAEGLPNVLRNGEPVPQTLAKSGLNAGEIVLLSDKAGARSVANGRCVAPARFIPTPSIAYRLARVAAGDAVATVSLNGPCGYDYAAGHALLLGAGGMFIDETGAPVRYSAGGESIVRHCFGGAPSAVRQLRAQDWGRQETEPQTLPAIALPWPRPAAGVALDRAVGCLFGQVAGDSLGSLVEFKSPAQIAAAYPDGVRALADGGTWNTLAGQPTDDSELALALARTLAGASDYDAEAVAAAYGRWYASHPFDIGGTTSQALSVAHAAKTGKAQAARQAASRDSQANGSLMRVAAIGIWARDAAEAAEAAAADSALSHPHPVCAAACASFAAAIHTGIAGGTLAAMLDAAMAAAAGNQAVLQRLETARSGQFPPDYTHNMGWVLLALQNAFAHLAAGHGAEAALVATVARGGDTDTNAAIAGALLGAAQGRAAFPARWRLAVLACRPLAALGAYRARPAEYWPTDLPRLAEALLMRKLGS